MKKTINSLSVLGHCNICLHTQSYLCFLSQKGQWEGSVLVLLPNVYYLEVFYEFEIVPCMMGVIKKSSRFLCHLLSVVVFFNQLQD